MKYNWQQPDWPKFTYDLNKLQKYLFEFAKVVGRATGSVETLDEKAQTEILIELLTTEALKTSEIEGEILRREDVMSSIRNQLGLNKKAEQIADKRAKGAAELMITVRKNYKRPLTQSMLFSWHSILMQGSKFVKIGKWRTHSEPMQIVSGSFHKTKVYFEAPPSKNVPDEMKRFLKWFKKNVSGEKDESELAPIKAAIAHLYFETIHPFEDGNGRIGRAISEKMLFLTLGKPIFISLSKVIEAEKKKYYAALQEAQKSNEITKWIEYFIEVVMKAHENTEKLISFTLKKAKFFDKYKNELNDRYLKVIRRMFQEGDKKFEGGMSAKKYIRITGVSKATATRDLQELARLKIFIPIGSGRSTHYELNLD